MNRTDYFLYIDTENEDLYEKWSDTPIEIKSYILINIYKKDSKLESFLLLALFIIIIYLYLIL